MSNAYSARRYLALWFPFLPADRLRLSTPLEASAGRDERPLVFVEKERGAMRLASVNVEAISTGLAPGMALADARARLPDLRVVEMDREADRLWLERLADACLSFTPLVALEEPDGIALDITGCAHLFGDDRKLLENLDAFLSGRGVALRAAMAATPDMARALARFGRDRLHDARDDRDVRGLRVAALEAGADATLACKRAGLRTIGDLANRPSLLLTARFGAALTTRLRRVLGQEDRRIVSRHAPPSYVVDHRCPEPLLRQQEIERALDLLVARVTPMLEARGEGGRVFEAVFFRTDGLVRSIRVETGRPTRDAGMLSRLYRERLDALADPLDPGFGFDAIRFSVTRAESLLQPQIGLDATEDGEKEISALLDRLVARFGGDRVLRLVPVDTHAPEGAQKLVPAADAPNEPAWPTPELDEPPARPLLLFDPPCAIEVMAEEPDGPPLRFRWRRARHDIRLVEGPERIAPSWWDRKAARRTRDYYRVETSEGRRFWMFRVEARDRGVSEPRWFLHGLFA